ncbi:hypothetical protein TRFO_24923 [Tritrichomonas foetus]|uniref:Uncharacterized protein n=1 Tax=Tritrichomonas foetus TaxID=1144522 RepID=A0A1J4K7H5_9EUKA|nr:hypothetical protein TRFO_24923 [Tritrichomonas foetus]|eukprot:OHT06954.1 hypothetical protein TRFO_24923 [Tritrichomonas foetus]
MKYYFDIHLFGIICSSLIICICIIVSYFDTKVTIPETCNSNPEIEIANFPEQFHIFIAEKINDASEKVFISAYNTNYDVIRRHYISFLKNAIEKEIAVSILISENDFDVDKTIELFKENGISDITKGPISMGFAIIDNQAFMFNEILSNTDGKKCVMTKFCNCNIAVDDFTTFFNFQKKRINNELPSIIPIKYQAKSSTIIPFYLNKSIKSQIDQKMKSNSHSKNDIYVNNQNEIETSIKTKIETGIENGIETKIETGFENGIETKIETGFENEIKAGIENEIETFYFFHNPSVYGDPLRISTADLIQSTLYLNANSEFTQNISFFSDKIPPYTNKEFSFYQVFTRVLMAGSSTLPIYIKYLVPEGQEIDNPWINTTAALSSTRIRLYKESSVGAQFMLIGNRAFVFSHSLCDDDVESNLGFHYSTNLSEIVKTLRNYFDTVWESSQKYVI